MDVNAENILNKKIQTCSGESGNDLFPIVNETSGKLSISSQLINDFPPGFGMISHNFSKKSICVSLAYVLHNTLIRIKNYLINIFEYFFLCFLLINLHLNPENNHLTESA